jgi:3-keto-5-aminohexanoate cleavage enzyme
MASLDCGTSNFGDDYIVNTLPMMREVALAMRQRGIRPTLECFDLSHIDTAEVLIREGLVSPPFHYGLVLGVPSGLRYDRQTLMLMVNRIPAGRRWTLIGVGGRIAEKKIETALSFGGNIRVGMEDNVYFEKGRLAQSNAELVARAAGMARSLGLGVATPGDVRQMLELRAE